MAEALPDTRGAADGATPAGQAGLELRGVTKRFGETPALRGVDLDVPVGQVTALIGPNGAGKSTLMRILATTVLPDAGSVLVAGRDAVADPRAARAAVGLTLGDERSFFWRLSGRQNLEFFARLQGLRRGALATRVRDVLECVGLADVAGRRVDRYSTGMRVRLGLARALLGTPPILLLDEPTRSLDDGAASGVRMLVRQLATSGRTSVLMATHDLAEAAEVADEVVVLSAGRVVARCRPPVDVAELRLWLGLR